MNKELKDGAVVAFGGFAQAIVYGMLAFAPLGAEGLRYGVYAGLASAVLGGAVGAVLGRAPVQFGGPRSSTALLIAGSLIAFQHTTQDPTLLTILIGIEVVLTAALLALAQQQGVGKLMQYLPAPVLIGMNTTLGLFSAIKLLPAMLGFAVYTGIFQLHASPDSMSWLAVLVSCATAAVLLWFRIARPNPLGLVFGLAAGFALHGVLTAGIDQHAFAANFNQVVGSPPAHPLADAGGLNATLAVLQNLFELLHTHPQLLLQLAVAALVIALLIVLESMQSLLMVDQTLGHRHSTWRELNTLALANLLCGLALALPSSNYASRSNAGLGVGSASRRSEGFYTMFLALLVLLLWPVIAHLPLHILATAVAVSSLFLIQGRTARLLLRFVNPRQHGAMDPQDRFTAWVVVGMLGTTALSNLLMGTLAGVVFVAVYFLRQQSSGGLQSIERAPVARSRTLRSRDERQQLHAAFNNTHWLHFDGNLFFGNASAIAIRMEDELTGAGALVLDFSQIRYVDDTACQSLEAALKKTREQSEPIALAVLPRAPEALTGLAMLKNALINSGVQCFHHIDDAFFHLENALLGKQETPLHANLAGQNALAHLQQSHLLDELSPAQAQAFASLWVWREVPQGQALFHEGDAADGLCVLATGQLSAWRKTALHSERLMRFCPGSLIGEMAVIDGKWRSATAIADTDCTLLHLPQAHISELEPALAQHMMHNLARELALRMRLANHHLDLLAVR